MYCIVGTGGIASYRISTFQSFRAGYGTTRHIRDGHHCADTGERPRARIIVNTMHEEIWFIKDLIQSAVDGILFKSIDSTKIAEAIRRVLDGGTYYCPYAEHVRAQMRRSDEGRREELTLRELDVLKRISEGKNTQEIAQELCVSTNTVDTHRRHLMDKLDARNVADLIMTAISKGIIPIRKC